MGTVVHRLLDVPSYQSTATVLRYRADGTGLELVEIRVVCFDSLIIYWGMDNLANQLLMLRVAGIKPQTPPALVDTGNQTATFLDSFGNTAGLINFHDPSLLRARAHRAVEKIALRNVRKTLDSLGVEDRQKCSANRPVLALKNLGLILNAVELLKVLPHKTPEPKSIIPLIGK